MEILGFEICKQKHPSLRAAFSAAWQSHRVNKVSVCSAYSPKVIASCLTMMRLTFFILLLPFANTAFAQDSTDLMGPGDRKMLEKAPYVTWEKPNYDAYSPDAKVMQKCAREVKEGLKFTIVMGTWCSDSKREVPRFLKLLDVLQIPSKSIKFIFVDRKKDDGVGEAAKLHVDLVPTFIVYDSEGKELGRVVEKPHRSLEKDLLHILK